MQSALRLWTVGVSKLTPTAHALRPFRVLPNGEGRTYSATTFPKNPWRGCSRFIRMCEAVGWVGGGAVEPYGVLDVLDINHDIVQDFAIPNARAFQQIKRRLDAAVEPALDKERSNG